MPKPTTALIICPPAPSRAKLIESKLLGLTIGERILLALEQAEVRRVAFIGDGPRPTSTRAQLQILSPEEITFGEDDSSFWLLPADLTFDKQLLSQSDPNEPAAVVQLESSKFNEVLDQPDQWLGTLTQNTQTAAQARFSIRVVDMPTQKRAQTLLLKSLRKPIDGIVSTHINRYLSLGTTRLIVNTGIRPNILTIFVIWFGIASGVFAAMGHWWSFLLAGVFFQAQSVFDGCDGEIARLTFRYSRLGQWLDSVSDDVTNYIFCLGLSVGLAKATGMWWYVYAGVAVFLLQAAMSTVLYRRMIMMGTGDLLAIPNMVTGEPSNTFWGKFVRTAHKVSKRDFFALAISVITALQMPQLAFVLFALGTIGMFWGIMLNEIRIIKSERA